MIIKKEVLYLTILLSGTKRSKELLTIFREKTQKLKDHHQVTPKLVVITVGEDPASQVYVGQKEKKANQIGFDFEWVKFPEAVPETELIAKIDELNADSKVNGMIVQLPLPQHLDERKMIERISPAKDVDGFHPYNLGKLIANQATVIPCTPKGILNLLKAHDITLSGKNVVIIGRSLIVGLPLQMLLTHENATVTVCHTKTKDLKAHTKRADIIVVATGRPGLLTKEHIQPGAVVIDVGINRLPDGSLAGDVAFEEVEDMVSAITPVPGGVGPMTVAMLMEQTLECACRQYEIDYQTL